MVILSPTRVEMFNQVLPRFGIKPVKVLIGKGPQQQLGLIEPRGMGGCVEYPQAWVAGEVALGVMGDLRPPIVHNEMDAAGLGVASFNLPHAPQEMIVVVFLQTPPEVRTHILTAHPS